MRTGQTIRAGSRGRGAAVWGVVCGLAAAVLLACWGELRGTAAEPAGPQPADPTQPIFSAEDVEFFEKRVRPILVHRCHECHSRAVAEPKGGLRLDSRAAVLTGGDTGAAIVLGRPQESLLIEAIEYRGDYHMPPKSKLPAEEVATLRAWVERGAPWPAEKAATQSTPTQPTAASKFDLSARKAAHWCWQPIGKPSLPPVRDPAAVQSPIDRFHQHALDAAQLRPAPPADRATLVRRATFDLIGLPPTPDEVAEFLADESPDAFARLLDRLLASPHLGERWGRHWLDLVRYGESRGHEMDYDLPNAFQYRDYVIRALNADVPYDQFVTEHIAGDLLPAPRIDPATGRHESILATGFWYLGEAVHSPVDIRRDETDRIDNALDVFSKTFLGVTLACARCHDHKFDAISTADYYALAGYLQSSECRQVRFETLEQERRIAGELQRLTAEHRPRIVRATVAALRPGVEKAAEYLLATRDPKQSKVDARLVARWTEELTRAKGDATHPLHAWAVLTSATPADANQQRARFEAALRSATDDPLTGGDVVVNYAAPRPGEWLPDGVAYGGGPVRLGDVLLSDHPQRPLAGVATFAMARREPAFAGLRPAPGSQQEPGRNGGWIAAGRSIRTPTFEVKHGPVHSLVIGGGAAYAAVDSHRMNAGPLHGELAVQWKDDHPGRPRWITHNLRTYRGHNAHLEFSAGEPGEFAVLGVVQGERPPSAVPAPHRQLQRDVATLFADQAPGETVAKRLGEEFLAAWDGLAADQPMSRGTAELADWLVRRVDLFAPSDGPATNAIAAAAEPYVAARRELLAPLRTESQLALAIWDGNGWDENLLIRGNANTPGARVPRRFLAALTPDASHLSTNSAGSTGSGRLDLARRVVDSENPLTSRVIANRVWHHLFGRGIVPTVDNFGVLGELPSHPQLLDHLARETIADGWSLKRLMRRIMLSSAYQMSSQLDPAAATTAAAADPTNRLWHRRELRRLEGEVIRDALLAISGRLDRRASGPSVPVHLTDFLTGRGRPGASGPLDGHGRRSIYLAVRRNFLAPLMQAFDTPIPFSTVGRRSRTNVPAQALILLNNPLVEQQAQLWSRQILAPPDATPAARITAMYQSAFARPPQPAELARCQAFLKQQSLAHGPAAPNNPRAWADLAQALWNTKEFVYVP